MVDDGGPAFPGGAPYDPRRESVEQMAAYVDRGGMTLRDYFAAWAIAIAHEAEGGGTIGDAEKQLGLESGKYRFEIHYPILLAKRAYAFADAMLKVRAQ